MSNEIKVGGTVRVARLQNTAEVYGVGVYGTTPVSTEGAVDEEVYWPYGRCVRVGKDIYHIDDLELMDPPLRAGDQAVIVGLDAGDKWYTTAAEFKVGDVVYIRDEVDEDGDLMISKEPTSATFYINEAGLRRYPATGGGKPTDADGVEINAGDTVTAVSTTAHLTAGKTYPVGSISEHGAFVRVVGDHGLVEGWGGSNFRVNAPVKTSGEFTIGDMVKMTSNAPAHGGGISGLVGKVVGRRGHYWGVEFDHVTDDIAQYNPYLVLQSEMGHFDPKCEWQGDEFVLAIREPLIGTVYGNIVRNRNRVLNAALAPSATRSPITGGISTVIRLTPEQIAQIKEAIK